MTTLSNLSVTNDFVTQLSGVDRRDQNIVPEEVPEAFYALVEPTPVNKNELIAWSHELANDFGLERPTEGDLQILAGNALHKQGSPFALRYGGHQFGHWAGQLGDGRAITLFEAKNSSGERHEFQLKGPGLTPFSRRADGRAVLRSSIREFLASEAMHALGVPTTRALSLVHTGELVRRDMFYDGHPEDEPGAIVCRVSPSFLRFGNFEIHAAYGENELLKQLTDWCIKEFFLECSGENAVQDWFRIVSERTVKLSMEWLRVGFTHGVLNTDNMSIHGITIDYGPFGWLDNYDPSWTPNTTDLPGRRYCFGKQPAIALWNLERLGAALLHGGLLSGDDLEQQLTQNQKIADTAFREMFASKLGITEASDKQQLELIEATSKLLQVLDIDYTIFFRRLSQNSDEGLKDAISEASYLPADKIETERIEKWMKLYGEITQPLDSSERRAGMRETNPKYILRNYMAQEAIEAAYDGDYSLTNALLKLLESPYSEQPEHEERWAKKRPEWALNKPGCSALSCSS